MAVSTSTNFAVTRDSIIKKALQILGVLGEGEDPNADQLSDSAFLLNGLTKTWQAEGLNLFAVQTLFLFPTEGKTTYILQSGMVDRCSTSLTSSNIIEVVDTDTVTVGTSGDQLIVGYVVGIPLTEGDMHWSTIASITDNGDDTYDVTFSDTIPVGETILSGGTLHSYPTSATYSNRPMKLLEAYTYLNSDLTNRVDVVSRRDFNELARKSTRGVANQVYFEPLVGSARLSVWPAPQSAHNPLQLVVQRTLGDFDTGTDNPDYPQEWFLPLVYNLAALLTDEYGTPIQEAARIERKADKFYEMAFGFDQEAETSIYYQPYDDYG